MSLFSITLHYYIMLHNDTIKNYLLINDTITSHYYILKVHYYIFTSLNCIITLHYYIMTSYYYIITSHYYIIPSLNYIITSHCNIITSYDYINHIIELHPLQKITYQLFLSWKVRWIRFLLIGCCQNP